MLAEIPGLDKLSDGARRELARSAETVRLEAGERLTEQGRTPVEGLDVVRSGRLGRYAENRGARTSDGQLGPGDVHGGLSLLMNAGLAIRTVEAVERTVLDRIPKRTFLTCVSENESLAGRFIRGHRERVETASGAAAVDDHRALRFLRGVPPFSFLPQGDLEAAAAERSTSTQAGGTVVFSQGTSRVDGLYVIVEGSAERFGEEQGERVLRGRLGEGECYGAISLLVNEGVAVRSLQTMEATTFCRIPREAFLSLCRKHPAFSEYFTDALGKRMLDRSYADLFRLSPRRRGEELRWYDRSIEKRFHGRVVRCPADRPVREAARQMNRKDCSAVFVTDAEENVVGIVTDSDLRRKVVAEGGGGDVRVGDVMSAPLISLSSRAMIFEALMAMMRHSVRHVAVTAEDGRVAGYITPEDLLRDQENAPLFVHREILAATDAEQIAEARQAVPPMVRSMIENGARADKVTRVVTAVSDTVLRRIVEISLEERPSPPCGFAFMIMGSEGRREQTLKTDQDNAIVYEDPTEGEAAGPVQEYFLELGDAICGRLDRAGYAFCTGGVMAKNPRWCQPLSRWKRIFHEWIHAAGPKDLLHASIFFDFRVGYGDDAIVDRLRESLFRSLDGWEGFFRHLVENALVFKPPLGFFRNFVVESKGEHRNELDLKSAMTPIVDMARVYALNNRIAETNTAARLRSLRKLGVFSRSECEEMEQAYGFLMQLRFVAQAKALTLESREVDNYLDPRELSAIQQTMLKEIFKRLGKLQSKMAFDFTGQV